MVKRDSMALLVPVLRFADSSVTATAPVFAQFYNLLKLNPEKWIKAGASFPFSFL